MLLFFWTCSVCHPRQRGERPCEWLPQKQYPASSLQTAKEALEKHEAEVHNSKPVGSFGWEKQKT